MDKNKDNLEKDTNEQKVVGNKSSIEKSQTDSKSGGPEEVKDDIFQERLEYSNIGEKGASKDELKNNSTNIASYNIIQNDVAQEINNITNKSVADIKVDEEVDFKQVEEVKETIIDVQPKESVIDDNVIELQTEEVEDNKNDISLAMTEIDERPQEAEDQNDSYRSKLINANSMDTVNSDVVVDNGTVLENDKKMLELESRSIPIPDDNNSKGDSSSTEETTNTNVNDVVESETLDEEQHDIEQVDEQIIVQEFEEEPVEEVTEQVANSEPVEEVVEQVVDSEPVEEVVEQVVDSEPVEEVVEEVTEQVANSEELDENIFNDSYRTEIRYSEQVVEREVEVEFEDTRMVEETFTNTREVEFEDTRMVDRVTEVVVEREVEIEFEDTRMVEETFTNTREVEFEDTRMVEETFTNTREVEFEDTRMVEETFTNTREVEETVLQTDIVSYNNNNKEVINPGSKGSVTYELGGETSEVSMSFSAYASDKDEGTITFIRDGEEVGSVSIDDYATGKKNMVNDVNVTNSDSFDTIRVDFNEGSAFHIQGVSSDSVEVVNEVTNTRTEEFEDTRMVEETFTNTRTEEFDDTRMVEETFTNTRTETIQEVEEQIVQVEETFVNTRTEEFEDTRMVEETFTNTRTEIVEETIQIEEQVVVQDEINVIDQFIVPDSKEFTNWVDQTEGDIGNQDSLLGNDWTQEINEDEGEERVENMEDVFESDYGGADFDDVGLDEVDNSDQNIT